MIYLASTEPGAQYWSVYFNRAFTMGCAKIEIDNDMWTKDFHNIVPKL